MKLQEMGTAYRAQAEVLQDRIRSLEAACVRLEDKEERNKMQGRIDLLTSIWRETRELAALLEHYYDRGYRRNAKYTI